MKPAKTRLKTLFRYDFKIKKPHGPIGVNEMPGVKVREAVTKTSKSRSQLCDGPKRMNAKTKLAMKQTNGFKSNENNEIALHHQLEGLLSQNQLTDIAEGAV
ncbi:MAG: hypothetical protein AAFP90_10270 [Planctomycetota bacterium]